MEIINIDFSHFKYILLTIVLYSYFSKILNAELSLVIEFIYITVLVVLLGFTRI